jgi:16S rRNA (uracil1498-N3)-methyltransferase
LYHRLILDFSQGENDTIPLTGEQEHYLKNVLRLKANDRFIALDGQGQAWIAEIGTRAANLVELIAESTELSVPVTLIVAIPKNGFDDIVRVATELGVSRIIPLLTQRGSVNPGRGKLDRWRKIAIEAVEQSERQIVPVIEEPRAFLEIVNNRSKSHQTAYLCVTRRKVDSLVSLLSDQPLGEITVAIGPEGGWTEEEIDRAIASGFLAVSLGKRILRTITAPLVALSLINAHLEA